MQKSPLVRMTTIACVITLAVLISACGSGNNPSPQTENQAPATDTAVIIPGPCTSATQEQVIKDVTVAESDSIIRAEYENPCFTLLDIRTRQEFDAGHLQGAMVLDYRDSTFTEKLGQLDRNRTYLIYCRTGHRTGLVMPVLKEMGFNTIYHMLGGITDWKKEGLPGVVDVKGNPGDVITVQ